MITKDDCLKILVKLEDNGVDKVKINSHIRQLMYSKELPTDTLKFIAANRGLEAVNFYAMLRKRYNEKKSPLYKNIVSELKDINEVVVSLSSLLTQIYLYARKIENKSLFLKEIRAAEIAMVLNKYAVDQTPEDCLKLLRLIKSDLLVLEYIAGRRDLQ